MLALSEEVKCSLQVEWGCGVVTARPLPDGTGTAMHLAIVRPTGRTAVLSNAIPMRKASVSASQEPVFEFDVVAESHTAGEWSRAFVCRFGAALGHPHPVAADGDCPCESRICRHPLDSSDSEPNCDSQLCENQRQDRDNSSDQAKVTEGSLYHSERRDSRQTTKQKYTQ